MGYKAIAVITLHGLQGYCWLAIHLDCMRYKAIAALALHPDCMEYKATAG